jgi:hypothetical protein
MARARNIKPGFFSNDKLAEVQPLGRILFAGLWTIADRAGRLEDRPKKIRAEVLPYDACNVDKLLDDLQERSFITRYEVGGVRFIQIRAFTKHQNPHKKEAESTIPEPCLAPVEHSASTVQEPVQTGASPADSLLLIPDSGFPIEAASPKAQPTTLGTRLSIETLPEEWETFCREERLDLNPAATFARFRDFWIAKPGKDGRKADWFATWRNWVRNTRADARSTAVPDYSLANVKD